MPDNKAVAGDGAVKPEPVNVLEEESIVNNTGKNALKSSDNGASGALNKEETSALVNTDKDKPLEETETLTKGTASEESALAETVIYKIDGDKKVKLNSNGKAFYGCGGIAHKDGNYVSHGLKPMPVVYLKDGKFLENADRKPFIGIMEYTGKDGTLIQNHYNGDGRLYRVVSGPSKAADYSYLRKEEDGGMSLGKGPLYKIRKTDGGKNLSVLSFDTKNNSISYRDNLNETETFTIKNDNYLQVCKYDENARLITEVKLVDLNGEKLVQTGVLDEGLKMDIPGYENGAIVVEKGDKKYLFPSSEEMYDKCTGQTIQDVVYTQRDEKYIQPIVQEEIASVIKKK